MLTIAFISLAIATVIYIALMRKLNSIIVIVFLIYTVMHHFSNALK